MENREFIRVDLRLSAAGKGFQRLPVHDPLRIDALALAAVLHPISWNFRCACRNLVGCRFQRLERGFDLFVALRAQRVWQESDVIGVPKHRQF